MTNRRFWASAGLVCLAIAGLGCGGSGGSPTEPPPPTSGPSIVFTPDEAASEGTFALRTGAATAGDILEVELVATDVPPVRDVDLQLTYPVALLQVEQVRMGDFLGGDVSLIAEDGTGIVTILTGRTVPGTASGSGVHVILRLRGIGEGSGRMDIIDPEARDGDDLVVGGIEWLGGTVRVDL